MTEQQTEIFELQTMLRLISQTNEAVPSVNPDGIFGPETERAVLAFQSIVGLSPNGIVDFATWNAITEAYRTAQNTTRCGLAFFPFPGNDYEAVPGEKSELVYIIQILLSGIDVVYDIFSETDISGVYDAKTENAVRVFQLLNRLSVTGTVNAETWDRLASDHNRFAFYPIYTG